MERNEREEILRNLKYGDVIKYPNSISGYNYLVVESVEDDRIFGQLAGPVGVNGVHLEEIASGNFSIADFRKIK